MFEHLAADADNEYAMIDSAIVRTHQHCAGAPKKDENQALGRSKGGVTTKIHALVDALGNPLRFLLTPGQVHDLAGADALLPQMTADLLIPTKPTMPTNASSRRSPPPEKPPRSRPDKTEPRRASSIGNSKGTPPPRRS